MKKLAPPLIFFVVVFGACEYNDESLIGPVTVRTGVEIENNARSVALAVSTESIYPNLYPILYHNTVTAKGFIITFEGVKTDGPALTMPGPATCYIDLGDLASGTYDIEFINGANRNVGSLEVTDTSVSLVIPRPAGLRVVTQ